MRGGKPIPNSWIGIPTAFAAIKCPNSWIKIRIPRERIKIMVTGIAVSVDI
jgi:hypothetical protein